MFILFYMRGCGRTVRPAFPAPSDWRVEGNYWQTSGAMRGENAKLCLNVIARSICDEAIHRSRAAMDCFAFARNDVFGCLTIESNHVVPGKRSATRDP